MRKNCFSNNAKIAKNKREGRTDGRTGGGGGALQYLPSRAFGAAGDKNKIKLIANLFLLLIIFFNSHPSSNIPTEV